ncbi:MAG: hypothetical protein ACFFE2_16075 [Candidatus Thorarchaeota archaeon]
MAEKRVVRELFVIHKSGLPVTHVGSGHIQIDDALFGGLLSAIENVGVSLGLEGDVALDTIRFRAYEMMYSRTENALIVLLTDQDVGGFLEKVKPELEHIGREIEAGGFMEDFEIHTTEKTTKIDSMIARHARTIFAEQDDVFFWDEDHTFQLQEHDNERWNGLALFRNYLMPSPLITTLDLPMEDLKALCNLLLEKRRPSEILESPELSVKEEARIERAMRLLHMYGLIQCFRSAI